MTGHELRVLEECSLFNSDKTYRQGYSRAVCECDWKSIPLCGEQALLLAHALHVNEQRQSPVHPEGVRLLQQVEKSK